jgi:hypothetical protein
MLLNLWTISFVCNTAFGHFGDPCVLGNEDAGYGRLFIVPPHTPTYVKFVSVVLSLFHLQQPRSAWP